MPIEETDFDQLWALSSASLEKTRTRMPFGALTIEVDRYADRLAALIVAEVEFQSLDDAKAFRPPAWFSREVTGDRRYSNAELAHAFGPPETMPH